MAVCDNCGSVTSRIRTMFIGARAKDECPNCAPGTFEAFKSVRDGQIAMGWEYMPTMYKHTEDGYVAKDELLADTEAQASKPSEEDEAAYQKAVAKKRQNRKTSLTPSEIQMCVSRAENMLDESRKSV